MKFFIFIFYFFFVSSCQIFNTCSSLKDTYYWRPSLHYSPPINWINDPNGLIYDSVTGLWHLFAQYNPYAEVWGSMSWSHAVSKDLIEWTEWPLAILTGADVAIFSGSAVKDYNTSGLCVEVSPCLIAVWAGDGLGKQTINLAYSTDSVYQSFSKYVNNPVIDIGSDNFRDPSVFWYPTSASSGYWVAVIAHSDQSKVEIWRADNLIQWKKVSEFGPDGNNGGWECPNMFQINNNNTNQSQWVLTVSVAGTPGSYWIGEFDGSTFSSNSSFHPIDVGYDWYAAISYNDAPDNRRVQIGWQSNWNYAASVPTSPWRGSYSIPRELTLHQHEDGMGNKIDLIHANPVKELYSYRKQKFGLSDPVIVSADDNSNIIRDQLKFSGGDIYEIAANLNASNCQNNCKFEFSLRLNENTGEAFRVGLIVPADGQPLIHFMDRANSGITNLPAPYNQSHQVPLISVKSSIDRAVPIDFHLLLDYNSVEVFVQGGLMAASYIFFPQPFQPNYALGFNVLSGEFRVNTLDVWQYRTPQQNSIGRKTEKF